ncbi:MAG: hypothetical protein M3Y69_05825 [Verrucomicrobiota bacterium]|nr:hypothetical protein [Verrucomicrobiota bacterium]
MTVAFASAVTNVSFQLWDVDASAGQFVDQVSQIKAISDLGVTQGASSISSAVAGFNTISGSGLSAVITGTANAGNATNQGTINVSFSGPITQFSFIWRNTDAALGAQAIALGEISYSVVPEMNATWGLLGLLGVAATHRWLSRKRRSPIARSDR